MLWDRASDDMQLRPHLGEIKQYEVFLKATLSAAMKSVNDSAS